MGPGGSSTQYPPASLLSWLEEEAMKVRAQACRDTLIQHRMVMASLLSTACLLVQPRAEWDARYLGIGALQIGSWNKREQENSVWPNLRNPRVAI